MDQIPCQIEEILEYEGGYVNDPDDPGGPTNFGITQATLSTWRGSQVTAKDVQDLNRSEALSIYRKMYYLDPRICDLHPEIQAPVLDMYIHSGSTAIRLLQKTICLSGYPVTKDGVVGPETIHASCVAWESMGVFLTDAYGLERIEYYYSLADRRAPSRKYATMRSGKKGGWIRRAERFMRDEFHIQEKEHEERTAAWA